MREKNIVARGRAGATILRERARLENEARQDVRLAHVVQAGEGEACCLLVFRWDVGSEPGMGDCCQDCMCVVSGKPLRAPGYRSLGSHPYFPGLQTGATGDSLV